MKEAYLAKAKVGKEMFGLVFGHGKIDYIDEGGFYTVFVTFDNGNQVPYTDEGIPAWGNYDYQTLFYKEDIELEALDFSTVEKLPTPKKIIKWRDKEKLEVKCPSGLWGDAVNCPVTYVEQLLEAGKLWMFRKIK